MVKYYKFDKNAIFTALDKLEPKPKTEFTVPEIIKQSRVKITLALKNGYTFAEIAKWFNNNGCNITSKELQSSYQKLKTTSKKTISTSNTNTKNNIGNKQTKTK